MKGNLTKAAGLFQAPLSQVARLAAALQEKKAADAPAEAAAPAAEAGPATDDVAAADTTPETADPATESPAADAASDD
jgi:large subunit ribosomal protein L10